MPGQASGELLNDSAPDKSKFDVKIAYQSEAKLHHEDKKTLRQYKVCVQCLRDTETFRKSFRTLQRLNEKIQTKSQRDLYP